MPKVDQNTRIYIPFYLRIARTFYHLLQGLRGEYFVYSLMQRLGLLPRTARFQYFDSLINIPLSNPETLYVTDWSLFHALREINFANLINKENEDFVLIDCGACYGQISMRLANLCPRLKKIVALEANPDNCSVLQDNLSLTGKDFVILNNAVSNFSGTAELVFPHGPFTPDSVYIRACESGKIEVRTLDDISAELGLAAGGINIALKIDIEGEEQAAVFGAEDLIRKASKLLIFIELHPEVLKRKNLTANELLLSVSNIRDTEWYLAENLDLKLALDTPIFSQIASENPCDVIGVCTTI